MRMRTQFLRTMATLAVILTAGGVLALGAVSRDAAKRNEPPEGFTALFNGVDLTGWKGLVANPERRAEMSPEQLKAAQKRANEDMRQHWEVVDGVLIFDGKGHSLCTEKDYKDFEMLVDWKIEPGGDSGIYLRGSPQVQIWDPSENPVGSGGLYNNQIGPSKPIKRADNPVGEWNTFRIRMIGDHVTVHLNGELVVDNVIMENYWDRTRPIYPSGQIELQSHGSQLYFRNIFIREIPREEQWSSLLEDDSLKGWQQVGGSGQAWRVEDGVLSCGGGGGWLATDKQHDDFELDFEYRLPENGNSGVFLRAPLEGNGAYQGMEIQLLDDYGSAYESLQPWQYTGSIYDVQPAFPAVAKSDPKWADRATKEAGEWQHMNIICDGKRVRVVINDRIVVDTYTDRYPDKFEKHPGLKRETGYIGFQYHGKSVDLRNIRLRELP